MGRVRMAARRSTSEAMSGPEYRAQAKAASEAVLLREAAGLTGNLPPAAKPRTARTVRTSGRGLPTTVPVTGVPVRPRLDPGWPGPSRTR